MSDPVTNTFVGKNVFKSSDSSFGYPNVENGHNAELNHVSNVSSSCFQCILPYFLHSFGSYLDTSIIQDS